MSDDQPLLNLLLHSVVRIDVAGAVSGTGFVVAPGQVLTCYHVLEPALASRGGLEHVDIRGFTSLDVSEKPLDDPILRPVSDLALVRVRSTADAPVVVLGEGAEVDDETFVYGFTAEKPQGRPATLTVEGHQGGPPKLIMLKSGQIVPGLSGAPLLNRRTGMICGVMRRTRDAQSSLGGLAIPIEVVLGDFDRLRLDNATGLKRDPRWRTTMTAQQRTSSERAESVDSGAAKELIVDVGQDEDRWTVSISLPLGGEDWRRSERIDLNVLRPDVAKLFRMLKASGRLTPVEQSRTVGQALAKTLWTEEVRGRLRALLSDSSSLLHISLRFQDNVDEDLQYLPWETMYLPETSPSARDAIRFAAHESATFTRVSSVHPANSGSPDGSLRVTVVRAPGEDSDKGPAASAEVITELVLQVGAALTEVPSAAAARATPLALNSLVQRSPMNVLHYVGYGRYSGGYDEIQLDGHPDERHAWLTADDFADLVRPHPPDLVVLQSCKGADADVPVDFTVLADALLQSGVKAVVAFSLPVDNDAARSFFREFYQQLSRGQPVRDAVQRGRTALEKGRRPWAFPALSMTMPGDLRLAAMATSSAASKG